MALDVVGDTLEELKIRKEGHAMKSRWVVLLAVSLTFLAVVPLASAQTVMKWGVVLQPGSSIPGCLWIPAFAGMTRGLTEL